jgi:peptide/nickel transport system permease protein
MSTETQTPAVDRGIVERIRASPFLSQLLSNRLAVTGLGIIALVVALAVYARFTYDLETLLATQFGVNPDEAPPSAQYPFGTDGQARNIFPRVLYGAWYAILYGTVTVAASTALGVGLGIVAAYYGDLTDNVLMRTMDVLLSFPSLLLALALVTIFPEELGLWRAVGALTLVYTPRFARVVRGAALKVLEDEYTDATRALGATDPRLLIRHVLPNCLAPITVQSTLNYGLAIIDIAALSFLGFGASPGEPTWGMSGDETEAAIELAAEAWRASGSK